METMMKQQKEMMENQQRMIGQLSQKVDQLATHNKTLETQIANQALSSSRPQGKLPSQPEQNPREHANAIFLRSGRELGDSGSEEVRDGESLRDEKSQEKVDDMTSKLMGEKWSKEIEERDHALLKNYAKEGKTSNEENKPKKESKPYIPPLPFPQR